MNVNKQREIWIDGREIPLERYDLWSLINNSALQNILVTLMQRKDGHFPQKTRLITDIKNETELNQLNPGDIVLAEPGLLDIAKTKGFKTCIFLAVEQSESLEQACQTATNYDYAIVDFDLPTNIPLELFIARLQERDTVLLRRTTTATETEVAFGVLEEGSDGVLFCGTDLHEIKEVSNLLNKTSLPPLELTPLLVTMTRHVGMGVRACIDTTGLMNQEEGMLVGSTSAGGILVCSETHYLPYMNLRPFRVNAGAVHSYIWMPNNAAEYITDLTVGSKVLCANYNGEVRELTVGRVKIEVRPLLLIKGEAHGQELNVIVQDDWHIRLMGVDGKPKNAIQIQPGDTLLAYLCNQGRHVGISVSETIIER